RATGTWRYTFWVVGALGTLWVVAWLALVRPRDLAGAAAGPAPSAGDPVEVRRAGPSSPQVRRFLALVVLVVMINAAWHFFRVWPPLFLQNEHNYSEAQTSFFLSAYYVATDLGALSAGFATLWLVRRGVTVHGSRAAVFLACSLLTALSL